MIEYCNKFLAEIEVLKPYLVEFEEDGSIKPKTYLNNCAIGGFEKRSVILITHDESTFNANDNCQQVWQRKSHSTLRPKGKGKRIIVSDFLLP